LCSRNSRASRASAASTPLEEYVRSAGYEDDDQGDSDAGAQPRGMQSENASHHGLSARRGSVPGGLRVQTGDFGDLSRGELLELQRRIASTLSSRDDRVD